MGKALKWAAAGLVLLGVSALTRQAEAVELVPGNILGIGGLNVTVSGCTLQNASQNSACNADDGLLLVGNVTGSQVTVTIESGAGNVFNAAAGDGNIYDLTVGLTISANPGTTVVGAGLGITGSGSAGDLQYIVAGDTVTLSDYNQTTLDVSLDAQSDAENGLTHSVFFVSQTQLGSSVDINDATALGEGPDEMSLATVSQTFTVTQVPEPSSIVLLLAGVAGVGGLRRRAQPN